MAVASAQRMRAAAAALSVTESKLKVKACSPEACKFLGIPDPCDRSRSPTALIISRFIRLHNNQSWNQGPELGAELEDTIARERQSWITGGYQVALTGIYLFHYQNHGCNGHYGQIEANKSNKAIKK